MFFTDHARGGRRFDAASKEKRLPVPIAKWLKHFVPTKKIEIQFREIELVIDVQSRLQIFIRQRCACHLSKFFREKIDIRLLNCEPGGHLMSPVLVDLFRAKSQRLHQIKTFNAAAATLSDAAFIKSDHNRWAMKLVRDPGSDDAEDARMPTAFEHDNRGVTFRIEFLRDFFLRRAENLFFH